MNGSRVPVYHPVPFLFGVMFGVCTAALIYVSSVKRVVLTVGRVN